MWAKCQHIEQICEGVVASRMGPCDWGRAWVKVPREQRRTALSQMVGAAVLSHSAQCNSQTSQHATAARPRLRRTVGHRRFDDLAASAKKLPGWTHLTLS